ncbi:MAG: hypothetical protein DRN27_06605 [Thermoplasmata archaeon]|nr:MAG: hypothetical protein DRN27_06605 [Thermoplasmata archaeon]
MEIKKNQYYLIVHLKPGENLLKSLITVCEKHSIITGVILSGIGQLTEVTLGYFKENNNYTPELFNETFELLSLSGTIIPHEETYLPHLHAVIGSERKKTFGGHLIDATVKVTNEIILLDIPIEISRKKSLVTGLMELSL